MILKSYLRTIINELIEEYDHIPPNFCDELIERLGDFIPMFDDLDDEDGDEEPAQLPYNED